MLTYILRRLLVMVPTLLLISMVSFGIIQLPPGDYLTSWVAQMEETGEQVDQAQVEALRKRYGLDRPLIYQYGKWMWGVVRLDFGPPGTFAIWKMSSREPHINPRPEDSERGSLAKSGEQPTRGSSRATRDDRSFADRHGGVLDQLPGRLLRVLRIKTYQRECGAVVATAQGHR